LKSSGCQDKIDIFEKKILMTIEYTSKNSFADQGLNINPISSVNTLDDHSLTLSGRSSFDGTINGSKIDNADVQKLNTSDAKIVSDATTQSYSSTSGYGLVNAAAAVAKSIGQNTFADVPNLGGNNGGADLVKAPEAWAKGYTGQGVVVAVVDTGVDYNHADLKDNIWTNTKEIPNNGVDDDGDGYIDDVRGWNFVNNTNEVMDDNNHGTHVSGTIAGENNGVGVTGIAYGAKIMPIKVLDNSGSGSYSAIANGIYYAVNHGANVVNLSLGGDFPNSTLSSAIDYASKKGVVVVMAAGNNGYPFVSYPAAYANKSGIAVGAVDKNNNIADFSNQPGFTQLAYVTAPGVDIYSTVPGDKYASYSGTSMATPHVAGVVALMLSANHNLTDEQVRQIITNSAANSTKTLTSTSNTSSWRQMIAEMTGNNLPDPTTSFKISSVSEDKTATLNPISELPSGSSFVNSNIGSQFRYYDNAVVNNSDRIWGDNFVNWE
jgi:subtilisin